MSLFFSPPRIDRILYCTAVEVDCNRANEFKKLNVRLDSYSRFRTHLYLPCVIDYINRMHKAIRREFRRFCKAQSIYYMIPVYFHYICFQIRFLVYIYYIFNNNSVRRIPQKTAMPRLVEEQVCTFARCGEGIGAARYES